MDVNFSEITTGPSKSSSNHRTYQLAAFLSKSGKYLEQKVQDLVQFDYELLLKILAVSLFYNQHSSHKTPSQNGSDLA